MAQEDSGDTGQIQVDPTVLAEPARPADAPMAKPETAQRRGGFWGPFTGGVLAAAAGFGAAQLVPAGWPLFSTSGTQAQIAAQEAEIAALKTDLAALAAAPRPDADVQAQIADPKFKLPKTYLVQVEGEAGEPALAQLRSGVQLNDGMTRPALAERIEDPQLWPRDPPVRFRKTVPDCWLRLTITEGRNRQVRRMCAAVGLPCLRLVRWSIGDWTLEGLAPGEWQPSHS